MKTIQIDKLEVNCDRGGHITLAPSSNGQLYMYVGGFEMGRDFALRTMSERNGRALRDALLAIYPLEQPNHKTVPETTWEVVADGIDRIKVPGGWIYQNIEDQMLFVAEPK